MATHKVTIIPVGKTLEISEETSLLQALKDNGFLIRSSCGGMANCRDCIIKIVSGEDHLQGPTFPEIKLLGNVFHITKERLSCQTKILGDVTIDISSHDQSPGGDLTNPRSFRKPIPTKLRKKTEQSSSPRYEKRPQVNPGKSQGPAEGDKQKESGWYKHWEKEKKGSFDDERGKRPGGGKRPKPFRYSVNDDEKEE